jgi:hypothetical protein
MAASLMKYASRLYDDENIIYRYESCVMHALAYYESEGLFNGVGLCYQDLTNLFRKSCKLLIMMKMCEASVAVLGQKGTCCMRYTMGYPC